MVYDAKVAEWRAGQQGDSRAAGLAEANSVSGIQLLSVGFDGQHDGILLVGAISKRVGVAALPYSNAAASTVGIIPVTDQSTFQLMKLTFKYEGEALEFHNLFGINIPCVHSIPCIDTENIPDTLIHQGAARQWNALFHRPAC